MHKISVLTGIVVHCGMSKNQSKTTDTRCSFKFVETKSTKGLVKKVKKLASDDGRSLSNYIGVVLIKHIETLNS